MSGVPRRKSVRDLRRRAEGLESAAEIGPIHEFIEDMEAEDRAQDRERDEFLQDLRRQRRGID